MWLLVVSIAALLVGPGLALVARPDGRLVHAIDGFVLVTMGGLVLLHLLPHSLTHGGVTAGVAAVLGLGLPLLVHRLLHSGPDHGHGHDHGHNQSHDHNHSHDHRHDGHSHSHDHGHNDHGHGHGHDHSHSHDHRHDGHSHSHSHSHSHDHGHNDHDHDHDQGHGHSDHGHDHAREPWLLLAAAGLALLVHAVIDGTALTGASDVHAGHHHNHAPHEPLPLLAGAVLLHRLPIGIALWWALAPRFGKGFAFATLGAMALATTAGYFGGELWMPGLAAMSVFEAFVAGALLHVIFHTHVAHGAAASCATPSVWGDGRTRAAGVGALLGLAALVVVDDGHPLTAAMAGHLEATEAFVTLTLESAPALLLAFVGAGLVRALLPDTALRWLGRGGATSQAMRGMAVGLPLPVCSCGVLPLYEALVKRGAPPAAALAFLVATPELGVDAFLISLPLLGVEIAIARLLAAAAVALLVALVVSRLIRAPQATADAAQANASRGSLGERLRDGLRYGTVDLFDTTAPWVVTGLVIASAAEPLLDTGVLSAIPRGWDVPLLALVGLPIYVCATGSTPLVAVLLHKGLSPGAGVAFLLTAPATNATTFGVLSKLHGRRVAVAFGVMAAVGAITAGLLANQWVSPVEALGLHDAADAAPPWYQSASAAVLALALGASLLRRGPRALVGEVVAPHVHD